MHYYDKQIRLILAATCTFSNLSVIRDGLWHSCQNQFHMSNTDLMSWMDFHRNVWLIENLSDSTQILIRAWHLWKTRFLKTYFIDCLDHYFWIVRRSGECVLIVSNPAVFKGLAGQICWLYIYLLCVSVTVITFPYSWTRCGYATGLFRSFGGRGDQFELFHFLQ